MPKPGQPSFNHVAMSVPAELLDESGRAALLAFYSEVFGWQELPTETVDRRKLVMMAYRVDQFVFVTADDAPMTCASLDHFGMGVATMAELDTFLERARRYQAKDPRVELSAKRSDKYPGLTLHSFYVRYLLPLMVEVQHFEFDAPPPRA